MASGTLIVLPKDFFPLLGQRSNKGKEVYKKEMIGISRNGAVPKKNWAAAQVEAAATEATAAREAALAAASEATTAVSSEATTAAKESRRRR